MRGVSTVGGDVVVLLGDKNDPEGVQRLAGGWPGSYTIDRDGQYRHSTGQISVRERDSGIQYNSRNTSWYLDEKEGVWAGLAPNYVHMDTWCKLRALRIVVE